jgi:hypothetical protein
MDSLLRLIGKVLRLVGISSPEDAAARKNAAPPSWKTASNADKTSADAQKKR